MKVIKLIFAILAALWTIGVAVGFVRQVGTHQGVVGTTEFVAGLAATAGCAAVTIWLFQSALRRP